MSPHAASMSTTWMVVHFDPPRCERQRAPRASDMLLSLVEPQQEQAIARMQIAIKVDSRPPRADGRPIVVEASLVAPVGGGLNRRGLPSW
jgi:hypothetical protein